MSLIWNNGDVETVRENEWKKKIWANRESVVQKIVVEKLREIQFVWMVDRLVGQNVYVAMKKWKIKAPAITM